MHSTTTFSGQKLRDRRKAQGVSRDTLAFCVGRTVGTIANYERGLTSPPADVLAELARFLECPVEELFEEASDD